MKKVIKQVVGIDVAQNELVVCLAKMHDDWTAALCAHKTFANTPAGFEALVQWTLKLSEPALDVRFVMEATGVYHERLAYFLFDRHLGVSIVLPNKISNYARSLTIKTVTDATASQAIARFGLDRDLELWQRPLPGYKKIRQLTRERDQIVAECTMVKNQLHAEQAEAEPLKASVQRIKERIELLSRQKKQIVAEIRELISVDAGIRSSVSLVCSIPGIGVLTAATVLAETNGFDLIGNRRQLVSYAGLDVQERQSGTSVKGKAHISKRGNRFVRKAMHLPALSAIRHDERFKGVFARLVARHGVKMKAVVAVQRKLLEMMFTVHKTQSRYDKNYYTNKQSVVAAQA